MFNNLYEFFLCPVHGIFRPEMWPLFVGPLIVFQAWVRCMIRGMRALPSNAQFTENQARTEAMTYEDVAAQIAAYAEKRRKK